LEVAKYEGRPSQMPTLQQPHQDEAEGFALLLR
jgi:hypothetical protein